MSTVERTLRRVPRARGRTLEQIAIRILERALAGLEGATLRVRLPGGETLRFGSGPTVDLTIHDRRFFHRLATRGKLGLGESYTAGEWEAKDLVALFELLLRNAEAAAARHPRVRRILSARPRVHRRNGALGARRNIEYHYDLGNELFGLFLDETMTYSCAVWEGEEESLEQAQLRKLRRICDKLALRPGHEVLEIGCGWGSFAQVAASEYGARVTALTISPSQAALARERAATAGLGDSIRIVEQDYREHDGSYDRIASIEMLEAIGEKQFGTFFATCDRLLRPGGVVCVQSILVPDQRWALYRATPDWIERYVFPGCLIPSHAALTQAMTRASSLIVHDLVEIGPHYAETLRRWRLRFHDNLPRVRELGYDRRFERTWDFYLAYCEAAFRVRSLRDVQLVLTRPFNESL